MHKDTSGHRIEGLVQDGLVGGSLKALIGEGVVCDAFSATSKIDKPKLKFKNIILV